jgi:hypothetical protein
MVSAIILVAFVLTVIGTARARKVNLRPVAAFDAMQRAANEAIELGRGVHVSFGGSALRDNSTLSAISIAEIVYLMADRTMLADYPVITTLTDPITLLLSQDTLRKAYNSRKLLQYEDTQSRWYPAGEGALAFAAGASIAMLDQEISTNILAGRFGAEMSILAENAVRYDRGVIAQSDRIDGQAVAFAVSDVPFIGEELYTSAAYLNREPIAIGGVFAQDVMRYLIIAALIGMAVLAFLGATL